MGHGPGVIVTVGRLWYDPMDGCGMIPMTLVDPVNSG